VYTGLLEARGSKRDVLLRTAFFDTPLDANARTISAFARRVRDAIVAGALGDTITDMSLAIVELTQASAEAKRGTVFLTADAGFHFPVTLKCFEPPPPPPPPASAAATKKRAADRAEDAAPPRAAKRPRVAARE
jgi:hypothetical protein